ncbi:monodechloroaminopyrrolnitrin synthase PrnB family protein [Catalinimonas sp. 4WD22]|uniref:monodechloroaminopyrrolnitrin synthase PrnB family protein n=1 Tax=Catalinimonas locisalis TaxID=3133978 RepID=UPI0031013799
MKTISLEVQSIPTFEEQKKIDQYICCLDPLQSDDRLKAVPSLNKKKDTIALVLMLVDMLPSVKEATDMDFYEACAAMRDIGIMLGSLKRHGVEPVHVIPELEVKLNILAETTDLPPRDTLIHYVRWNPEGKRQRTYTGTEDERQLIKSVSIAIHPLHEAIRSLNDLYHIPLSSEDFIPTCERVITYFDGMVQGIVNAKRNVSPQYFAEELRFYFDPIELNDREYLGPGAVEMPVFVFDHMLWNCDLEDTDYDEFKQAYLPYNQAGMRELYDAYRHLPSLVNKCISELDHANEISEIRLFSARRLVKLFNLLKSFRAPHKKMADEAYEHAAKDAYREKGSGGYEPGILHYILNLNLQALERLKNSIHWYEERQPFQS